MHRTVTLDGFLGDALTADGAQLLYGAGGTVNFAPSWPVCPSPRHMPAAGLSIRPNADSFVLKKQDLCCWPARAAAS